MNFYLLIIIFVLSGVSLHIQLILGIKNQFDKVLLFFLVYTMVHALHAGIVTKLPVSYYYIDYAAPFGLLYGPIGYFAFKTSFKVVGEFTLRRILIHAIPFLCGIPFYIFLLLSDTFRFHYIDIYYIVLYTAMALEWIGYSLWIICFDMRKKDTLSENSIFILAVVMVLFTLGIFVLLLVGNVLITNQKVSVGSNFFVFLFMLLIVMLVYVLLMQKLSATKFTKKKAEEQNTLSTNQTSISLEDKALDSSYQKSKIQGDMLRDYLLRIDEYMETKPYLNPKFNLVQLARDLKIYKHHLSQIFNKEYGQSFSVFVNSKRIEYACSLLNQKESDYSMEELAERCGFNSKASFYRNFNEFMGCSPVSYRNYI